MSILSEYKNKVFRTVKLRIRFRDKVLAGIPKGESVLDYFMEARHMSDEAKEEFKQRIKNGELTEEEKEGIKESAWCEFERDENGNLCMWHGNVKAMLREVFVTLGLTQKRPNTSKPKAKDETIKVDVTAWRTCRSPAHRLRARWKTDHESRWLR